ncbi:MAG: hypothetical protein RLZZ253_3149 [Verrucomicrobiota bacterium]|jgi:hypothetical protein
MTHILQRLCLLGAGLMLAGCASIKTSRQPLAGVPAQLQVTQLPGCPVRVSDPAEAIARKNDQGFVEVQVIVRNPSSSPRDFAYSWEWFAGDGSASFTPAARVPRMGRIEGLDQTVLRTVSTVSHPAGVILRLGPQK